RWKTTASGRCAGKIAKNSDRAAIKQRKNSGKATRKLVGVEQAPLATNATPHPPAPSPIKREGEKFADVVFSFPPCGVGGRNAERSSEGWGVECGTYLPAQ